jgi:hypothetical protein
MIATAIQVAGILLVAVGAFMLLPAAGLMVAGVGLLAFGLAAERGS